MWRHAESVAICCKDKLKPGQVQWFANHPNLATSEWLLSTDAGDILVQMSVCRASCLIDESAESWF